MYKIFIVFHKQIFDECYAEIPQEILDKHFVFVAVNPNIPKIYTPGRYNIINEWDLPILNKTLDNSILRENTVIYNVYANKLYEGCDYIGFAQYDMKFSAASLSNINNITSSSYLALWPCSISFCKNTAYNGNNIINEIVKSYNSFFSTTIQDDIKVPLCNTYIIQTSLFEKIMPWVIDTYHFLIPLTTAPNTAGIYERVMGIAIGAEKLLVLPFELNHDHGYKQKSY
jgi:hypothetical protein